MTLLIARSRTVCLVTIPIFPKVLVHLDKASTHGPKLVQEIPTQVMVEIGVREDGFIGVGLE